MESMLQRRPARIASCSTPSARIHHKNTRSLFLPSRSSPRKLPQTIVSLHQSTAITSHHLGISCPPPLSNLQLNKPALSPTPSRLNSYRSRKSPTPRQSSHPEDCSCASAPITHPHCQSTTPATTNTNPTTAATAPSFRDASTTPPAASCTRRTASFSLAAALATSATSSLPTSSARAATAPSERNPVTSPPSSTTATTPSSRFAAQATSPAGQNQSAPDPQQQQRQPPRRLWLPVPQVALAPGLRVSKVIRGCWQLSGRHRGDPRTDRTSGGEAVADLATFHRAGVTSLDTADNYGPSEALVGQYLRLNPDYAPRTTVLTKLSYLTEEDMAGVSRMLVQYAVRGCLARQGRSQLDLVQLQWAEPDRHRRWLDVLKWLADLREEGLIRHVGVCNFSVPLLAKAVDAGVGLVSNQVAFSLIDRRPQLYMQQAAEAYGIKLLAYGTLAGGLLVDNYYEVPAARVRLDTASKQKYGMLLNQAGSGDSDVATTLGSTSRGGGGWGWMQEILTATGSVAQRHGVSSSAVALAWVLQQPQVAAAVVGARNARHVRDLQAACSLTLDDTDMLDLDAVWEGVPNPPSSDVYTWERGGSW